MLKIAAVFTTTSVLAGLLVSAPGLASIGSQVATVKVKTIAIHMQARAIGGFTPMQVSADRFDPLTGLDGHVLADNTAVADNS